MLQSVGLQKVGHDLANEQPPPPGIKAEAPILWPLDVNIKLIGKDPDAGQD